MDFNLHEMEFNQIEIYFYGLKRKTINGKRIIVSMWIGMLHNGIEIVKPNRAKPSHAMCSLLMVHKFYLSKPNSSMHKHIYVPLPVLFESN